MKKQTLTIQFYPTYNMLRFFSGTKKLFDVLDVSDVIGTLSIISLPPLSQWETTEWGKELHGEFKFRKAAK